MCLSKLTNNILGTSQLCAQHNCSSATVNCNLVSWWEAWQGAFPNRTWPPLWNTPTALSVEKWIKHFCKSIKHTGMSGAMGTDSFSLPLLCVLVYSTATLTLAPCCSAAFPFVTSDLTSLPTRSFSLYQKKSVYCFYIVSDLKHLNASSFRLSSSEDPKDAVTRIYRKHAV